LAFLCFLDCFLLVRLLFMARLEIVKEMLMAHAWDAL